MVLYYTIVYIRYIVYTIYTKHLIRNGVVILTDKKGLGRNHGVISQVKKKNLRNRALEPV